MSEGAAVALTFGFALFSVSALVLYVLKLRFRRRELQHQEWMAALEKGVPLPELNSLETSMGASRVYLLRGLIWLAIGLTLTLFLSAMWLTSSGDRESISTRARQERELVELGYSREEARRMLPPIGMTIKPSFPLGLSVIGLVPAGVGLAYLVFYRLETRRPR